MPIKRGLLKKLLAMLFLVMALWSYSVKSLAQGAAGANGGASDAASSLFLADSINDVYTVIGTTSGGALLGLSTLSFVEHPSDHLKRVVIGGAIGLIIGVGIIAFKTASTGQNLYYEGHNPGAYRPAAFSTDARLAWHREAHEKLSRAGLPAQMSYQFSF